MFAHHESTFPDITIEKVKYSCDDLTFDTFTAKKDGKPVVCKEPRATDWYSEHDFHYSNKVMKAKPMPPFFVEMIKKLQEFTGTTYDSVLINLYPHGKSGMRYHQDPLYNSEGKQIWADDAAVISVGSTRQFVLRDIDEKDRKYHYFSVKNGDMMRMFNGCQSHYQHAVKVEKTKEAVGERCSLVFKKRL
jgi:alkylated DNA repair dioxygenase AlkB